jgi:riboflavin kinase/FMN adenylyltransferase
MRIFYSFNEYSKINAQNYGQIALCIGNFDGVHIGHKALIQKTKQLSYAMGGSSCLLTFEPHPVKVLLPKASYNPLFDLSDRLQQFEQQGIDEVILQPFDLEFAQVSAEDFIEEYLLKKIRPQHVIVGYNFSFGKKGLGNSEMLKQKLNKVSIVPPVEWNGYVVSTSKIKDLLQSGNVSEAKECLGRSYSFLGNVVKGDQRGRQIKFPTANILHPLAGNLKKGVYCTQTTINEQRFNSITNVGVNPTVNTEIPSLKVETHIFNFSEDIYGKEIKVEFIKFIRPEKKFSSLNELQLQIQRDVDQAHKIFSTTTIGQDI